MLEYYLRMWQDERRLRAFREAFQRLDLRGQTVAEVGTGLGMFAFFACAAGAEHVYAIEPHDIIGKARELARTNGWAERITFVQGDARSVRLPAPVDLLVTEHFDPFFLHASVDEVILGCRERLLKPGGRFLPEEVALFMAPISTPEFYAQLEHPVRLARELGIEARPLLATIYGKPIYRAFSAGELVAPPREVHHLRLREATTAHFSANLSFELACAGDVHGLLGWFDLRLLEGLVLSNHPQFTATAWQQAFFPISPPLAAAAGDRLQVELATFPWIDVIWKWRVRQLRSADGATSPTVVAVRNHDSFGSILCTEESLGRQGDDWQPLLNERGRIDAAILDGCRRGLAAQAIIEELRASFGDIVRDEAYARGLLAETLRHRVEVAGRSGGGDHPAASRSGSPTTTSGAASN